jgi:hypothetical protein
MTRADLLVELVPKGPTLRAEGGDAGVDGFVQLVAQFQ